MFYLFIIPHLVNLPLTVFQKRKHKNHSASNHKDFNGLAPKLALNFVDKWWSLCRYSSLAN
jgi:hypothetical protein